MNQAIRDEKERRLRTPADVRAMAITAQANLVQLRVADAKRIGIASDSHEIKVSSPGAVQRFREALIDRHHISSYTDFELKLRLRETWGKFCVFAWVFHQDPADASCNVATLPENVEMRCASAVEAKHAEIHAVLWRLRFEQSRRVDPNHSKTSTYASDQIAAERIPAKVQGQELEKCTDQELLLGACEHAGMLATLAWIADPGSTWGAPELMEVGDRPF